MAISDKTRKLLWGRAQMRCSFCKNKLDIDATPLDNESIIGDECHIISPRINGPRHKSDYPIEKVDSYENLILLCKVHHKMIDDQFETYTTEVLYQIKNNHEKWISEKIEKSQEKFELPKIKIKRIKENIPEYFTRLKTWENLLEIINGADACHLSHDDLHDENEVEKVGSFLQMVQDWGDFSSDLDVSYRVNASYELGQSLNDLEAIGFFVFGAKEIQIMESGFEQPTNFLVAHIRVLHQENEEILNREQLFRYIVDTYKNKL